MLFAPFLMIYLLIALAFLAILFLLIQIELISYAFRVLGLRPRAALFVLLVSLLGSYLNIPLYTVESGPRPLVATINYFGIVYAIPFEYAGPKTTVAVNIGGALVPLAVTAYALTRTPEAILPSVLGTAVVAFVTHQFARPIRGLGIALPVFVPPITAALAAIILAPRAHRRHIVHVIAYTSGVLGTLIGADLTNLHKVANLGAPVVSIGGAGTFDGIFLTGVTAVLLAAL